MKHLISSEQFTREYIDKILMKSRIVKINLMGKPCIDDRLNNSIVATLFYEPSTRTRLSFESAIMRLGGKNISTENAKKMSSAIKGETLEDTIRVISGYCDAIVLRHSDDDSSERAARVSSVPIINAGAGKAEHPTQALLDAFTIWENKETLDGLKICISGDLRHGRTIHSLVKLLSLYDNVEIFGVHRDLFELPTKYIKYLADKGITYRPYNNFAELPRDLDVIYHTRTQTERFQMSMEYNELVITPDTLKKFDDVIVMHPLPRVTEISTEVDNMSQAKYFEQAHNGTYVRMAILLDIFR